MEVLYDHSSILLQNEDEELAQDVRILMSAVTLEELTRIWDSLKEPYSAFCLLRSPGYSNCLGQKTGAGTSNRSRRRFRR